MARKEHFISVRPFLPHALLATGGVILIPLAIVGGLLALLDPNPPLVLSAFVGVALAIAMMAIGAGIWLRYPQSSDIGFADLMLWRWNRRRRAEESLKHGARLLGLDRSGQPIDDVRISPEQQLQVLKDLTNALESKDPYTHGHSQRVERHTYRTAAAMGLAVGDIEDLRKAAALHDVGKIRVPDRILRKAGPLDDHERAVVEEHAVVGAWMVSSVGNADVIAAVRHHHERWDGTGYPDGLAGPDVPLFARVIAVADAYDAITSTRPYRASSGREDAVSALRSGSGSQFDPDIVESFISALPSRVPIAAGLFLLMGTGPSRLFREIAVWFRRFGAGSLTPAAGATGAAIVLGASIFTPSVVDGAPTFERNAAAVTEADNAPDEVTVNVQEEKDDDKAPKKEQKNTRPNRKDRNGGRQNTDAGNPDDGNQAEDTVRGSTTTAAGNNNDGGGSNDGGNNQPPEPPDPPEPDPAPAPPTNGAEENQNDARDKCDDDGNAGHGNDGREC